MSSTGKRWFLGRVVAPAGVVERGAVGIEGETITYAGPAEGAPRDPRDPATQVAGWITPGLIDLHLHGAGGRDPMDGTPESLRQVSRTLAEHGTTAYLATSMVRRDIPTNRHLEVAAELAGVSSDGAEVLGIHVEGPFVNPARGGLIRPDRIWPPDLSDLAKILAIAKGRLRMMTLAPELPGGMELLPRLADAGAVGSLGHTEATFDQARAGFRGGVRHITHLYNAMRGLHHREPGALGAALMDHGVTVQLIPDGVHVHPDLLRWTAEVLRPEQIALITDALPAAGLPDGVYSYDGRNYRSVNGTAWYEPNPKTGTRYRTTLRYLVPKAGLVPRGEQKLFGTTRLLDEMVRRAVKFMGVSFPQAILMATLNPARTLGLEKERGVLEAGRRADLVLWSENYEVVETVIGGKTAKVTAGI
ncbi:MAG: N-acetylglucosamine-6-phosphate deacetylase [Candidatus Omnitrophica bacterium]|nr:N-acetylglucosamine-6-phosphate deacetylase [Candidatus Omnitrophota bacterium]